MNNWKSETKQRVSVSLTRTAWRSLDQEAQKRGISRSEVIEQFARSLEVEPFGRDLTATIQIVDRTVATILESITDAFVAFDRDWHYTYVNHAAAQILHKTPEELIGRHVWNDVFPELVGGVAYQAMHRAIAEQVPVAWEEFGEPIQCWLEVNAYPSPEGIAVYFRNVTERKQAEAEREQLLQELERERAQLKAVLQQMPAGVLIAEAASNQLVLANEQAKRIIGYDFEESHELEDYVPITPFQAFRPNGQIYEPEEYPLPRSLRTGEVVANEELELRYEDGSCTIISVSSSPIFNKQGQILAAVAMFQDVTRLKHIEENLRQTEERLQLALSSAQMFAWDTDLRTQEVVCSPNATEIWGFHRGPSTAFHALMHPDDRQSVLQAVEQVIAGDTFFSQEYRVSSPDGALRWLKSQGRVYRDEAGRATRMIGVSANITAQVEARRQAEALLKELQQKEKQQQFLIELNDAIRALQDSEAIMWQVVSTTGQHFDVTRCTYGEIDATQEYVTVDRDYCNGVISVAGKHHMDSFGSALIAELKQGKTVVVNDVNRDPRTTGSGAAAFEALQTKSLLCVPLVKQGRFVALFVLHHIATRQWTADDVELMERIATKTWLAVERSRAEAELRESEAHLQLALKVGRMGTWDWDMQTNTVTWSDGQFAIMGLQSNETSPSYEVWAKSVHPDDLAATEAVLQQAMQERTEFHHEYRTLWPDGSGHWTEARGRFTYNAAQQPTRMIGVLIDITERKQAEQEREQLLERERLARSQAEAVQQQLATIVDTSPIGLALLDAEQRFIAINEALAEINGLPREHHLGKSVPELFSDVDPAIVEVIHQIYATGHPFISPNLPINAPGHDDRRPGYYNVYYLPTVDSNHQVESLLAYIVDVTEQVKLEQAQQFLSEASAVLASSLDYQTTLEQVAQLTVPKLADWCTIHIVEEDDRIDQIAIAHIDPAKLEWAYQLREKYPFNPDDARGAAFTLRTGQPDFVANIPDELLVQAARDPEHLEILRQVGFRSFMCVPLRTQTRIIGVISFIAAESGRRYTAADLQLAEELARRASLAIENAQLYQTAQQDRAASEAARSAAEAANRIKDEFLAVLSHELRSPLNPILGWAKLLQSRKLDATKTAQALATIERNAKLQAELIEDLLDVSRILRGKLSLNVAPVNLAVVIREAMETIRLAAEAKSIQITATLASDVGLVLGDSTRLQQVVWNLLSNAVKFTPSGGQVNIQLERIDSSAQITVSDTGQGITPDFLPYVFDYFRQADAATTRKFGGLGLGLAIVRHLVELHGGQVEVTSPGVGLGAIFTVRLPLQLIQTTAEQNNQSSELSADLTGIQVLVVDDEADSREFVAFVLEQAKATVMTATTANEALSLLIQVKPDVLLSDIGMPEVDGYTLLQWVRALLPEQGGQIPAIALTAYAGELDQQQALSVGFQRHVAKPAEPEHLVRAILSLLERNGDVVQIQSKVIDG
ncbi:PAS domain S-box protein [Pantanalinema rosaneae CENA516]|uniref:PAS domain S-box protein n=1 Tax=Pantanalinema rosaneae TaxID=1620701 RepID=UPI003D6F0114